MTSSYCCCASESHFAIAIENTFPSCAFFPFVVVDRARPSGVLTSFGFTGAHEPQNAQSGVKRSHPPAVSVGRVLEIEREIAIVPAERSGYSPKRKRSLNFQGMSGPRSRFSIQTGMPGGDSAAEAGFVSPGTSVTKRLEGRCCSFGKRIKAVVGSEKAQGNLWMSCRSLTPPSLLHGCERTYSHIRGGSGYDHY